MREFRLLLTSCRVVIITYCRYGRYESSVSGCRSPGFTQSKYHPVQASHVCDTKKCHSQAPGDVPGSTNKHTHWLSDGSWECPCTNEVLGDCCGLSPIATYIAKHKTRLLNRYAEPHSTLYQQCITSTRSSREWCPSSNVELVSPLLSMIE